MLLLNPFVTIRILLLSAPHRVGACGSGAVHNLPEVSVKQTENEEVAQSVLCCRRSVWTLWTPKNNRKRLGKVCKLCFIALILRVPCILVLQTIASVMSESKKLSNIAIKRSAKSPVS